jgi:hypothetical protein
MTVCLTACAYVVEFRKRGCISDICAASVDTFIRNEVRAKNTVSRRLLSLKQQIYVIVWRKGANRRDDAMKTV